MPILFSEQARKILGMAKVATGFSKEYNYSTLIAS